MGIVDTVLMDIETPSGQQYRIEQNEDGDIHIHSGHVRLDLTPSEFRELAATVLNGRDELLGMKDELNRK